MKYEDFTYLFLEQWQRLEELPHFPEPKVSELHFLFNEEEESGGLPTEETWDRFVIWKAHAGDDIEGCLLSSPVSEEMKELPAEEYEKLRVFEESFLLIIGRWREVETVGGICCKGVALKIIGSEGWTCRVCDGGGCGKGAFLKRAWPVLVFSSNEITRLNLETAMSATALQSLSISIVVLLLLLGFEGEKEEEEDEEGWYLWRASERSFMSFSTLSKPEAASWTAFSSALVVKVWFLL